MPAISNVRDNIATTEFMKFVSLSADTNFPMLSAVFGYDELSATQAFFKAAILTYNVGSGSGNTRAQTKSIGNPDFIPSTVMIYNSAATPAAVRFTLVSGLSCDIWVAATNTSTAQLAVSGVNIYNGCTVTYIAP